MEKFKKWLWPAFSLLFFVALWAILSAAFDKPLLFPTPVATLRALFRLLGTADFYKTVAFSLLRILSGILLALLCGTILAFLTVRFSLLHHLLSPFFTLFKATPIAPVIFLLLLWVGRVRIPMLIAFMMALPIVWGNLREGILCTDRNLLEMAALYRVPRARQIRRIYLPSILPYFLAACRSSLSLSWKAGIAAEVLCTPKNSIGAHIYEGKLYLLTDEMFAWTLTVILLSLLIEKGALSLLQMTGKNRIGDLEKEDAA